MNRSAGRKPRRRKQPDQEYSLFAHVRSVASSSYYVSKHRESEISADEAIIDLLAEIVEITPKMPEHKERNYLLFDLLALLSS